MSSTTPPPPSFGSSNLRFEKGALHAGDTTYDITVNIGGRSVVLNEKWDELDSKIQVFATKLFAELQTDSTSKDISIEGAVLHGKTINKVDIDNDTMAGLVKALSYGIFHQFETNRERIQQADALFNPLESEQKLLSDTESVTDRGLWHVMGASGRSALRSLGKKELDFALPASSLQLALREAFDPSILSTHPDKEKIHIFKEKLQKCQQDYHTTRAQAGAIITRIANAEKAEKSSKAEKLRNQLIQHFMQQVDPLKENDYTLNTWLIPVRQNERGENENHVIMTKVEKKPENNYSVSIFNTGTGGEADQSATTFSHITKDDLEIFFKGMSYIHDPQLNFEEKKAALEKMKIIPPADYLTKTHAKACVVRHLLPGAGTPSQPWTGNPDNTCTWDVITQSLRSTLSDRDFKEWELLTQAKAIKSFTEANHSLLLTSDFHRKLVRGAIEHVQAECSGSAAEETVLENLKAALDSYASYYTSLTNEAIGEAENPFSKGLSPKITIDKR
jgi:hypothetical protein